MISELLSTRSGPTTVWSDGDGRPMLLLHGFSDAGSCWEPVTGWLLDAGFRVIAPDARGHGGTPLVPGDPFTSERRAADAAAVLDLLGAGSVTVVGHSMGAVTAMELAVSRPELVDRLVLEDPVLRDDEPSEPAVPEANEMEQWAREVSGLTIEHLVDRSKREHPDWPAAERRPWAESKRALDLALFGLAHQWSSRPWRELTAAIGGPILVVTGEVDRGAYFTREQEHFFATTLGAMVVRVPDAGHNVRRDQPAAFRNAVLEFLSAA